MEERPLLELFRRYKNLFVIEGILFTLLGIFAISLPQVFSLTLDYFIGWVFIFSAIAIAIRSFQATEMPDRTAAIVSTLLYLVLGVLLLVYPMTGILTLTLLLALYFLLDGIIKIYSSLQIKPISNWGWILTSGILSLILSGLIIGYWPQEASWMLGMLVGINLLVTGIITLTFIYNLNE